MKNRRKILISCLVLGSLGGYAFLNLPEKENTEIIKENIVNEEVKKDSVEVAALKNNLEAFKQKELTELDEKYLYYSMESEISNIDLKVYTDSENKLNVRAFKEALIFFYISLNELKNAQ